MESNRAVGVQFVALNKKFKAFAKESVILCAGAIGSPKILMLSGFGPKKHLEDLKVNFFLNFLYSILTFHNDLIICNL